MPLQDLPEILLLCRDDAFIQGFQTALSTYWPSYPNSSITTTTTSADPNHPTTPPVIVTPINSTLASLPDTTTFDLIVSPANSYARLDGAFDLAISRALCPAPKQDLGAVTRVCQRVVYEKWRGFASPGSCTLVRLPGGRKEEEEEEGRRGEGEGQGQRQGQDRDMWRNNRFRCGFVAVVPTMRVPQSARWDREVVYEGTWSLLGEVEKWNRRVRERKGEDDGKEEEEDGAERIGRMLMTPLATGAGGVSVERWAAQTVLALKHFVDAVERPEKWRKLEWPDAIDLTREVRQTWKTGDDDW